MNWLKKYAWLVVTAMLVYACIFTICNEINKLNERITAINEHVISLGDTLRGTEWNINHDMQAIADSVLVLQAERLELDTKMKSLVGEVHRGMK